MEKKISLGIDLMFVDDPEHVSGILLHAKDILKGLQEIDKLRYCRIYTNSNCKNYFSRKYPEAEVPNLDSYSRVYKDYIMKTYQKITGRSGSGTIGRLERSFYVKSAQKCDVVLHTFHHDLNNNIIPGVKNIWVFHDFFAETLDIYDKKTKIKIHGKYLERLKGSDAIVTISNFVENDMYRFFPGINVSSTYVIPNSISIDTSKDNTLIPDHISCPYILNINAIRTQKNHITLVKAFQLIMDRIPHSLVLVGEQYEAFTELNQYISKNNLSERVTFFSGISEKAKCSLYANASLFVTPSLNEGFGRTPIEAAMFKVPVISTRCESLPEVTMELLNYYDPPCNEHILAEKIMEVLLKEPNGEMLGKISDIYREKYSSRKIAEQYWDLIEKVYYQ